MNLRLFSVAVLVSAFPLFTFGKGTTISFNRGGFIAVERDSRNGETLVKVKSSKSGKAKTKKAKL